MFATIYVPNFYLQAALRHHPQVRALPVALINAEDPKAIIIQLNEIAEQAGVRAGMTPSQGLARCLQLLVKARNPQQEQQMQEVLVEAGFSLAPYVESTAPGVCTVEFTKPRDIENKVAQAVDQLLRCDVVSRAGIAAAPDASLLAAHLASPILKIDDPKTFLASLPIETLSILTY